MTIHTRNAESTHLAATNRRAHLLALSAVAVAALIACDPARESAPVDVEAVADTTTRPGERNVIEIVARGLQFDAPASTHAGFTTIRLRNDSSMVHFALLQRVPDGIGLAEHQAQVAPVFQEGMDLLNAGDTEGAMNAFGKLPAWFHDIVFVGGPGLVSGGRTAEVTLDLQPGTYLIECYVKTGGRFHSFNPVPGENGMVAQLEVTRQRTDAAPPKPDWRVELSATTGMRMSGKPVAGPQVIGVRFADQQAHENFVGHDLHVARIAEATDRDQLGAWLDWRSPRGLETPAPVTFIGGLNEMPADAEGFVHVDLEPGRYALLSEVPGAMQKNLYVEFEVR